MELNVFGFGRKKPKEEQPTQVLEGESCKSYVIELMKEYFSALDHFQFIGATAVLKDKKVFCLHYISLFHTCICVPRQLTIVTQKNLAIAMPWASLLTPLLTLTSCEDTYYSLAFMEPKQLKREVSTGPPSISHN